jgi:hypothetical protein
MSTRFDHELVSPEAGSWSSDHSARWFDGTSEMVFVVGDLIVVRSMVTHAPHEVRWGGIACLFLAPSGGREENHFSFDSEYEET